MLIKTADYVKSSPDVQKCPEPNLPEYAFIGRSNVGKSSLINLITGRKRLAKISSSPGKTQLINHFIINSGWYLVDLPGYGYAKRSKKEREQWGRMIHGYLIKRRNLVCTFILIDARIEPQKIDDELIDWMGVNELPFLLVLTKTDKLSKQKLHQFLDRYGNHLLKRWAQLPHIIISSAVTGTGREEILDFIGENNTMFMEQVEARDKGNR